MSGVEVQGLEALQRRFADMPEAVDRTLADAIEAEIDPLIVTMRSMAGRYGKVPAKAAATARVEGTAGGLQVRVGGGSGLGSTLLYGAEYGGRKRPRRPYATRRGDTAYIVRRRATMQFLPHLGSRGYWFWQSARQDLKGINSRVGQVLREALHGTRG
jgi:hypothetical protein